MDDTVNGLRGVRASVSAELLDAVRGAYGLGALDDIDDLGGSSSLNIHVRDGNHRYVVRVYRPYVTAARLNDIHHVRRVLIDQGLPCQNALPTKDGQPWTTFAARLVEVERYVEHDGRMNSWDRLKAALPLLGRMHAALRDVEVSPDGRNPLFANHIEPHAVRRKTLRGIRRLRSWATPAEQGLADASDELVQRVVAAEGDSVAALPRQLVHGDFWDNNVLFRGGKVVLVADFDFMGERARIDDLALTLFFTCLQYPENPVSDEQLANLRSLVDAYDSGLDEPLTKAERSALGPALARQPLWSIGGWVALLDEPGARQHAAASGWEVEWALRLAREFDRWERAFV